MHIDSSAPTRIDLAGGTMDIWPLYLFHRGAQTLNAALGIRAYCRVASRADRRIVIRSEDTGHTLEAAGWRELADATELKLIARLLHHFEVEGVDITTRSDSPVGAGIAGSSALNIAICGALSRWSGRQLSPDALLHVAMNVEAQAIDVPTGVQDYRPALYGGVSAVELRVDGVRRTAIPVDAGELERRLVLVYTGASRNSGINNWDIFKRHIDGDRTIHAHFDRIRDIACAMRHALEAGDWDEVGRRIGDEWETRKSLAPGVTTPEIDRLMEQARAAGALAAKVCGAGGGGCLFAYTPPDRKSAVRDALAAAGAQVLDCRLSEEGLRVADGEQ